ncbi:MAG: recombinase family protein [Oscillospiraceae bacterium]|nr:recombinase family protein [Oscillospiraceae bacterium]
MSRKSRKYLENPIAPTHSLSLRAAAYLRVPVEKLTSPQVSIEIQLKIIEAFLDHRPDLTLTSTYADVDDRGFQREGFQQMVQAIESSKINCVIVTDLSILGRDLIEIGYYIESYLPCHNIRLISISDQIKPADEISKQNSEFASGDYADQLRRQIVLLQYVVEKVNLQIERQGFLIERLKPNVQKGLITPEEGEEFRFTFESKKKELVQMRNHLLEMILRSRAKTS